MAAPVVPNESSVKESSLALKHMWLCAHELVESAPELAAFYMRNFQATSVEDEIPIDPAVSRRSCGNCGTVLVAGHSLFSLLSAWIVMGVVVPM
jgi:RNase P subunit RPR2